MLVLLLLLFARSRHRNATNLSREPFFSLSLSQEQQQLFFFLAFVCDVYLLLFLKNKKVKICPVFTFYISLLLLHLSFCSVCSFCSFFSLSLSTELFNPLSFLNCEHRLEFYSLSIRKRRSSVTAPILDKKAFGSSRIYFTRGFSPETPLKTSIIRAYVFDALPFSFCFLFFFCSSFCVSFLGEAGEKSTFTGEHPKKKKKKKKRETSDA